MPDENLFKKVPVKVQNRSGYDKSNHNIFTGCIGQLLPMFCEEVIPNHTISTKVAISTQLPPLATDTFMRLSQKVEAFFVPTRLLMKDYERWITRNHKLEYSGGTSLIAPPCIQVPYNNLHAASLLDYLGCMVSKAGIDACRESGANPSKVTLSAFPVLCYNLIWDEWYRNSLIQKSCFYNEAEYALEHLNDASALKKYELSKMKFITPTNSLGHTDPGVITTGTAHFTGADGYDMLAIRMRNFGLDYFTSATPSPQNGPASVINIDTSGASGTLSISAIRSANSIQQFEERQNLAGNRLVDFVKAQYGANLSDMIAQRPVLLGSASFDVYSKGIYQTANNSENAVALNNPFDASVGARFGSAYAEGNDFIIKDFTANEPGYIMIITSLVPRVTYSSGLKRYLRHYLSENSQGDMANPILQNVGPQPIYQYELNDTNMFQLNDSSIDDVFGYADRYSEFKSNQDELHGLIRDGYDLSSFALQRTFHSQSVEISDDFLQIPYFYLDQILAYTDSNTRLFDYWTDSYIQAFESMPLSRYSIPTLQDPAYEHGHTVVLDKGGVKLG